MSINNTPFAVSGAQAQKEGEKKTDNALLIGTIKEVRYDAEGSPPKNDEAPWFTNEDVKKQFRGPLYRVKIGDTLTYWIPQLHVRASNDQEYWAYEVGEQVVVLSPSGDPMQGFVLGSLPQDKHRPPVGFDDKTKDKRPWRETVNRRRYKDGHLWEYDRVLHRELSLFPDKTRFTYWFHDDRTVRKKEADSDKTGVPPRHWEHRLYSDKLEAQILWDEDSKHHHRQYKWPDTAIFEYLWQEKEKIHTQHWLYADGTDRIHRWSEEPKTHEEKWQWKDGYQTHYFWDEENKLHRHTVKYADWRTCEYLWNEKDKTHLRTETLADGTVQKYHWFETDKVHLHETAYADGTVQKYRWNETEDSHLHETAYADGTVMKYQWKDPHQHLIQYADGTVLQYDLTTHKLTVNTVGDIDVKAKGKLSATIEGDISAQSNGQISISAKGAVNISSDDVINLVAPSVNIKRKNSARGLSVGSSMNFIGNATMEGSLNIQGNLDILGVSAEQGAPVPPPRE